MLGTDGMHKYEWNPCALFPTGLYFQPVIRETTMEAGEAFIGWLSDICEDRGWFPWAHRFNSFRIREEYGQVQVKLSEGTWTLPPAKEALHNIPDALLRCSGVWQCIMDQLHRAWTERNLDMLVELPQTPSLVKEQLSLLHWLLRHYIEPIPNLDGIPQIVIIPS